MSDSRSNPLATKVLAALHAHIQATTEDSQQTHSAHLALLDAEQVCTQFYNLIDDSGAALHITFAYFARLFAHKPAQKTVFASEPSPTVKPKRLTVVIPPVTDEEKDITEITIEQIDNSTAAPAVSQAAEAPNVAADDPETPVTHTTAEGDDNVNFLEIMNRICDLIGHTAFTNAADAAEVLEKFIEILEATPNSSILEVLRQIRLKEKSIQPSDDTRKSLAEVFHKALAAAVPVPAPTPDPTPAPARPRPGFIFPLPLKLEKTNDVLVLQRIKEILKLTPNPDDDNDAETLVTAIRQSGKEMEELVQELSDPSFDMKSLRILPNIEGLLDTAYTEAGNKLPPKKKNISDYDDTATTPAADDKKVEVEVEVTLQQRMLAETRNEFAQALTGLSYLELTNIPAEDQKQSQTNAVHDIHTALSIKRTIIEAILTQRKYALLIADDRVHKIFLNLSDLVKARQNEISAFRRQWRVIDNQIQQLDDDFSKEAEQQIAAFQKEREDLEKAINHLVAKHNAILKRFVDGLGEKQVLPREFVMEILDSIYRFSIAEVHKEVAPVASTEQHTRTQLLAKASGSAAAAAATAAAPVDDEAEEKAQRARYARASQKRIPKQTAAASVSGLRFHLPRISVAPEEKENTGRSLAYLTNVKESGATAAAASAAQAAGVVVATTVDLSVIQADTLPAAPAPASTAAAAPMMSVNMNAVAVPDTLAVTKAPLTSTASSSMSSTPSAFALLRKEIEEFKPSNLNKIKPKPPLNRVATAPEPVLSLAATLGFTDAPAKGVLNLSHVPSVLPHTATSVLEKKTENARVVSAVDVSTAPTKGAAALDATIMALPATGSKEQVLEKKTENQPLNISLLASIHTASAGTTHAALSTALAATVATPPDATVMALAGRMPGAPTVGIKSKVVQSTTGAAYEPELDKKIKKPKTAASAPATKPAVDIKAELLLGEANFLQADLDELIKRAKSLTDPHIDPLMMSLEYKIEDLEKIIKETIAEAESQIRPLCEKFGEATHTKQIVLPVKLPLTGNSQEKLEAIIKIHNYLIEELEKFYKKRQLADAKLHTALDQKLDEFETDLTRQLKALQPEETLSESQAHLAQELLEFETSVSPNNQKAFDQKLAEFKAYLIKYYEKYYKSAERKLLIAKLDTDLQLPDKKLVIHNLIKAIRDNKIHIQALQKKLAASNIVTDLVTKITVCLVATRDQVPAVRAAVDTHPKNSTPKMIVTFVDSLKMAIRKHLDHMLLALPDDELTRYRTAVQLMLMIRDIYAEKLKAPGANIEKFTDELKALKNKFIIAIRQFIDNAKLKDAEKQKADLEKNLPSDLQNSRMKKGLMSILKFYIDAYAITQGIRATIPTKLAFLLQRTQALNQKNAIDLAERAKFEGKFNAIKKEFMELLPHTIAAIDVTLEGKLRIKYHTHPTIAEELAVAANKDLNYMSKDIVDVSLQLLNDADMKKKEAEVLRENVIANLRYVLSLDLRKATDRGILFKLYSDIQTEPANLFNKKIAPANALVAASAPVPSVVRNLAVLHRAVTAVVTKRDVSPAAAANPLSAKK